MKKTSYAPQLVTVLEHINKAGHITVQQAMVDHSIAALPRRIADLEERGFLFKRDNRTHPVTRQRYVRYSFAEGSPKNWVEADKANALYR